MDTKHLIGQTRELSASAKAWWAIYRECRDNGGTHEGASNYASAKMKHLGGLRSAWSKTIKPACTSFGQGR